MYTSKWNRAYWSDLAERVGETFLGALLTTSILTGATSVDWSDEKAVWAVLGAPTGFKLVTGLMANLAKKNTFGANLRSGLPLDNK